MDTHPSVPDLLQVTLVPLDLFSFQIFSIVMGRAQKDQAELEPKLLQLLSPRIDGLLIFTLIKAPIF